MAGEQNISSSSGAVFAESFTVDFGVRLPQFDTPGGAAYAAVNKHDVTQPIYALAHNFEIPMRDRVTDRLLKKNIKHYNNLIEQGMYPVSEGGAEARRFISIVERPLGPSLNSEEGRARITIKFLKSSFLRGALIALAELHGNKIHHRAITPANIFFVDDVSDDIVLGECFSCPAGSMQPSSYSTLERSASSPMGRGLGGEGDDIFALGACCMTLILSDPIKKSDGVTDEFFARIEKGSYRFLEGNKKVPDLFEPLIRGLMLDEEDHRWGLGEVAQFIDGHMPRLSTGGDSHGLSKPVTFGGHNHTDRRTLAHSMSLDIPKTVQYFSEVEISDWVASNLTSVILSENAEALIKGSAKSQSLNSSAELVARVCAFLDPKGPLRYNGLAITYDGFGPMVAISFMEETGITLSTLKDILSSNVITDISKIVGDGNQILFDASGSLIWGGEFLRAERLGKGMERVLYEFNPKLPCQSDKFKGYWVRSASSCLIRLDQILGKTGSGANLLDKHVSAFCSAKAKGLDGMFGKLPNGDLPTGLNASRFIDTMGAIQARLKTGPLPNLCVKLCEGLRSIVKDIHYQPRREMLAKRLDQLSSSGSLANVSGQLKLAQHRAADAQEFSRASQLFSHLERSIAQNKMVVKATDPRAIYKGYNGVSLIGMILVVASVIVTVAGS